MRIQPASNFEASLQCRRTATSTVTGVVLEQQEYGLLHIDPGARTQHDLACVVMARPEAAQLRRVERANEHCISQYFFALFPAPLHQPALPLHCIGVVSGF